MPPLLRGRVGGAALGPGCLRAPRERHPEGPRPLPFQGGVRVVGSLQRWSLQPARREISRREVSEWIGLGKAGSRALERACGSRRTWLRPGRTWLVKPRLVAVAVGERGLGLVPRQRAAPPVLGGGRSSGEASAAPSTRVSRARERMLARTLVPDPGIRRPAVVLADRVGCRSRRAALGPGRKALGLARRLPAQAGELGGRRRAGSRVAVAKATCA